MEFGWLIVYVADVSKTVAFYEAAFGLSKRFITDEKDYAELETGQTRLAFASDTLAITNVSDYRRNRLGVSPAGIEIAFVTEDVPAAYRKAIGAGAISLSEPITKSWGQVVAYVLDQNGVIVEIATPIAS